MKKIFRILLLLLFSAVNLKAQDTSSPVIFKGDTLYLIQVKIGAFSPEQRADLVRKNINQIAKLPLSEFDSLVVVDKTSSADILYKQTVIASVSQEDANMEGKSVNQLAEEHLQIIRDALTKDYHDTSLSRLGKDILLFILALIGLFLVFRLVNRIFNYWHRNLHKLQRNIIFRNNKIIKFFNVITAETERRILLFLLKLFRFFVLGVFLYFYLPLLFSQISYTRGFGKQLLEYILRPLRFLGNSIVDFLPNLFFIIIIIVAVRYLIQGLGYIARQIQHEKVKISGFFPDWAFPTFNLFRSLIIIFTVVVIFPYLPGSDSDAFQGISVFIGLLLSLGSAGAISNAISGVILTYMRPFKVGDRVKINEVTGDIVNKNLLVTKIKTVKNEEITIPNALLLSGGIVNYTTLAKEYGLILHTTVTIGYDAPWKQVHQLLEEAAVRTEYIEKEPSPFILQKSLDDWYVAYELNAYTKESFKIPKIYSDLHANIQDVFNEAGLEIMSSHYMAVRDGNQIAVPQNYLSKDYQPPSFKVKNEPK